MLGGVGWIRDLATRFNDRLTVAEPRAPQASADDGYGGRLEPAGITIGQILD